MTAPASTVPLLSADGVAKVHTAMRAVNDPIVGSFRDLKPAARAIVAARAEDERRRSVAALRAQLRHHATEARRLRAAIRELES